MIRTTEASRSAVVAVTTVRCNLVLCSQAGYAFARLRFLGRGLLFVVIMTTLMVPFQVTMIPLGLATFQGAHSTEWTLLMAGNVMSLAPMLLIFFVAQRYFIRSVAATGLAGT
jgi:ABC-type glycerol-3-phosphate transport system permease component